MRVVHEVIIKLLHGCILRNPPIQMTAVVSVDCIAKCDDQFPIRRVSYLRQQVARTLFVPPPDFDVSIELRRTHRAVVIALHLLESLIHPVGLISSSPDAFRNWCIVLCNRGCICFGATVGCSNTVAWWIPCRRVVRGWIRLSSGCNAGRLCCVRRLRCWIRSRGTCWWRVCGPL